MLKWVYPWPWRLLLLLLQSERCWWEEGDEIEREDDERERGETVGGSL